MDQLVKPDERPGSADPGAAVHQQAPGVAVEDLLCELVEVQQRHRLLGGLHVGPGRALQLIHLVYLACTPLQLECEMSNSGTTFQFHSEAPLDDPVLLWHLTHELDTDLVVHHKLLSHRGGPVPVRLLLPILHKLGDHD